MVTGMAKTSFSLPGLQVYFQSARAGLDAQLTANLTQFIEETQTSLDCAIYDLRDATIVAALKKVADSGKQIRIAFDNSVPDTVGRNGDPKHGDTEDLLQEAGLTQYATAVHTSGRHLMHNKFLIRDGRWLWTGSSNFTDGGLQKQDNNCLVIDSQPLAADYRKYFESLSTDKHTKKHTRHTQTKAAAHTHATGVMVGDVKITPYFEPTADEDIEESIIAALKKAKKVRVLAMLISDPGILDALYPFNTANADIKGVYDVQEMSWTKRSRWLQSDPHQNPPLTWFMNDPTRWVGFHSTPFSRTDPNFVADFMHNKVMIIDDRIVVTCSYNFSENAELNDENLLFIESDKVAAAYTEYFDTLFNYYIQARSHQHPAVDHHYQAAYHLHNAAEQHSKAAQAYQANDHVTARRHAHQAHGNHLYAVEHVNEATKKTLND